ncbi:MAG: DNA-directed RNA polymerase specialized sigma24 family protein [Saprospiraceae bacterium]|jgi:DNA-directed RNA polymerase specialized sigma24 family protein
MLGCSYLLFTKDIGHNATYLHTNKLLVNFRTFILSFYVEDIHRYEGVVDDIDDKEILEVRLENLKIIMTQMPSGDQSILMMKYLDGMSIKEISSALSKTESAIKMKLKRAKHRFVKIHRENVVDTY